MLRNDFERDISGISEWFVDNDIFVIDQGYRDAIPLLERIGIDHKMPALLALKSNYQLNKVMNLV